MLQERASSEILFVTAHLGQFAQHRPRVPGLLSSKSVFVDAMHCVLLRSMQHPFYKNVLNKQTKQTKTFGRA